MKILFVGNVPSPYRVDFFNELGKFCDLTVLYERRTASDRDAKWKGAGAESFTEVFLDLIPFGADRGIGFRTAEEIQKRSFDKLVICGYSSPSVILAITWCRLKKIPYYIESDGGFNKRDKFPKSLLKKFLLSGAVGHFVTCEEYKSYLLSLGIQKERIYRYPFTSIRQSDILSAPLSFAEKQMQKKKLGISEKKIVLAVGRFIKGKGFDVLIRAAKSLPDGVGVYFVGGTPTEEYRHLEEELQLSSLHFVGFKKKEEIREYYMAADLFVLPTREDIWGLVINEAMAYGLPVITTDKCIAGLELVKNGENGYIVESDHPAELAARISEIIEDDGKCAEMGQKCLKTAEAYTIENMAKSHIRIFKALPLN